MPNPMLVEAIEQWMKWDCESSKSSAEIKQMVEEENWDQLEKIMLKRLAFGTAGIRGRMGPGFGQMNDLVIVQTTQGLINYLISVHGEASLRSMGAVIGFDARHNSSRWARLAAGVFLRRGVKVHLFSGICPTPFVPFTVKRRGGAIGVMVTASHNPKDDNGYKVFWSNGPQILSPHDANIQESILESLAPEGTNAFSDDLSIYGDLVIDPMEDTMRDYYSYIESSLYDKQGLNRTFQGRPLVYTAMHGVGANFIDKAMEVAGFPSPVIHVAGQREPDPEFPTTPFPNPEEGKTALNLSFETADANGAIYILANDPDADRLAVVQKVEGKWRIFSGNELGALLGWWMFKVTTEKDPEVDRSKLHFINTTVSSKMLSSIAKAEGLTYTETLTGFKWMANKAVEIEEGTEEGHKVLMAFEEAIGYMCSTGVLDKDGVSAAVRVAELIAYLDKSGKTLFDKLTELFQKYGYHCSNNSYFLYQDPEVIPKIFMPLRHWRNGERNTYPETIGDGKYRVVGVRDLWHESPYDSNREDGIPTLPSDPKCEAVTLNIHNGIQITLRTSGTEPKVKYYSEYCAQPSETDWKALEQGLDEFVTICTEELIKPKANGLTAKK